MTAEPAADALPLGVLCFISFRDAEAHVMERLHAAGFEDLTVAQARVAARIAPTGTRMRDLADYQVNEAVMAEASPDALFMHCLPAHRGEEVSAGVIDGLQSVVFDEAENRMHTAQALLVALITGQLAGADALSSTAG